MPVKMADLSSMLGSVNTASFLFGDEEDHKHGRQAAQAVQANPTASPDAKTYLQLHTNDDKFPILVRREGDGNMQFSASSAGMDLASQGEIHPMTDRATTAKLHRQSLPPSAMRLSAHTGEGAMSPLNGILTDFNTAKNTAANRRSLEVKFSGIGETKRPGLLASPKHGSTNGFPKLQSSYSTNDIPTLKSTNGITISADNKSAAVQSPHHTFASPEHQAPLLNNLGTSVNRHTEQAIETSKPDDQTGGYLAQRSALQPSAVPFGPPVTAVAPEATHTVGGIASPPMTTYGTPAPAYYGGYGMPLLTNAFSGMYLGNSQGQWPGQAQQMQAYQGGFNGYSQQYPQAVAPRFPPENQTRAVQQRRNHNNGEGMCLPLNSMTYNSHITDTSRFTNMKLEDLVGEIYGLCKDQHGCRYLQKKLEDRDPESIQVIFDETSPHVVELMTGMFITTYVKT